MIVAVFSDVHGNLPALQAFVDVTVRHVDRYICLGDVVNYGPWNDECLELTHSLPGIVLLAGNHERLFTGEESIEHEIPLVQQFYHHSIRRFSRRDLIEQLPQRVSLDDLICVHTINDLRIYADTAIIPDDKYVIGHTHHQFRIQHGENFIVNCGSIGQNRAVIDVAQYALYDTKTKGLELHQVVYPFQQFIDALHAESYPQACIDYYMQKRKSIS